jgi:hypothetical protein
MLSHLPFKTKLTLLFCLLDDFLALLPPTRNQACPQANPQRAALAVLALPKSLP